MFSPFVIGRQVCFGFGDEEVIITRSDADPLS